MEPMIDDAATANMEIGMAIFGSISRPKMRKGTAKIVPPAPKRPKIRPTTMPIRIKLMNLLS
jgi:hypothetical protein